MRVTRVVTMIAAVVIAGVSVAGCSGPRHPAGSPRGAPSRATSGTSPARAPNRASTGPAAPPAATWPTFDVNAARTGALAGVPAAGRLTIAWRTRLDGAVYGQPLVVGDMVIAATENDSVYALDSATGAIRWRVHVDTPVPLADLPCGDINPLGITGTPVYDRENGLIYAVAETTGYRHVLVGLSVTSGAVQVKRAIPAPDGHPRFDQQRPALTVEAGRVYVAFGGLFGDCGEYAGSVVGVPVTGRGPLVSYRVPTAKGGAIWGTAGPVIGPNGTLYVATGNGAATGGTFDGSDSVTALTPDLRRVGVFAPNTWAADNAADLDLGSTSPALLPDDTLLQVGKRGVGFLLDAGRLGGVGGQLAAAPVCPAYGAAAVSGNVVYEPCLSGGVAAVNVTGDRIRVLWRGPAGTDGSPVVGGGAVWVTEWPSGVLDELDPATGAVRASVDLGASLPHFASASLAGSQVFVGTVSGVVAVRGA